MSQLTNGFNNGLCHMVPIRGEKKEKKTVKIAATTKVLH